VVRASSGDLARMTCQGEEVVEGVLVVEPAGVDVMRYRISSIIPSTDLSRVHWRQHTYALGDRLIQIKP
jgi:hypothetical protein